MWYDFTKTNENTHTKSCSNYFLLLVRYLDNLLLVRYLGNCFFFIIKKQGSILY